MKAVTAITNMGYYIFNLYGSTDEATLTRAWLINKKMYVSTAQA